MTEDPNRPALKVTDNRHFQQTGEKRLDATTSHDVPTDAGGIPVAQNDPSADRARAPSDFSEVATSLSSSFSLLIARLAQETEIYLGLLPYPGKDQPEPDLEASRAMIDMLSMLQDKTRSNLDPDEARLIESLLYTYRLEFVRQFPGGGQR